MIASTIALPAPLRWTVGIHHEHAEFEFVRQGDVRERFTGDGDVTEPTMRPSRSATQMVACAARVATSWICSMYGWSALAK